jgi:4-amino-4-deoxy-L-arabinose transferase-like glycosyltransferase
MWMLPIFCWLLWVLFFARRGSGWRSSFLLAAVVWGCLLVAFTEFLSCFRLLGFYGIAACWVAASLALVPPLFRSRDRLPLGRPETALFERALLGGIGVICLATFITAIVSPPNTWDSMTYHMSRVMHWLQNRSVAHYPTHIVRQIELNPGAEFVITHFQALSGGDRFANLVQWFSMLGSLIGASLIAGELGGGRRAQLFASVFAVTIPMGILQSSSTQNDYVLSFWLICLAWAGLKFMRGKDLRWALVFGASLGLAVLSKGTAYLYAFPFCIWITLSLAHAVPRRKAALAIVCICVPFFLLNGSHFQRNFELFSNPLHSGRASYTNEDISPGTVASNLLRSVALQLATPVENLNSLVDNTVRRLHEILELDINDPETTWISAEFKVHRLSLDEDGTANILHLTLIGGALLSIFFLGGGRKLQAPVFGYWAVLAAGLFLFCLVLKWQPWQSRLLLPLFVLSAPIVGVVLVSCWKSCLVNMVALMLLLSSFPWVFCNSNRPLLVRLSKLEMGTFPIFRYDRDRLYFFNGPPGLFEEFKKIAGEIRQRNVTKVGLVLEEHSWEYPLWVFLNQDGSNPVRLEHVEVDNVSRLTRGEDIRPDYYVRMK